MNSDVSQIISNLKRASAISNLELPLAVGALLALIPGVVDETTVGISAVLLFAILAFGRRYLVKHREEYLTSLKSAVSQGTISEPEYKSAIRDLNTLTIEGGQRAA